MAAPARAARPGSRTETTTGARTASRQPATRTQPVRSRAATPQLRVVSTRRQAVRLAAVLGASLFVLLFGVTAFQTHLAQNQLELDRTDDQIGIERERYDQLRLERAELLAPQRLMTEAAALGMVPGSSTEFVAVDARTVAEIAVSAGGIPEHERRQRADPFEEYGEVKAMVDGAG